MTFAVCALALAYAPQTPTIKPLRTLYGVRALAFAPAPTGSHFAATMQDNTIRIIDAASGQTLKTLTGHPQPCYGLAWSEDGKYLATGDESARIFVWDTNTWKRILMVRKHTRGIEDLSISHDDKYLMSTGRDDYIKIYNLHTGKVVLDLAGKGINFYGAHFDPDADSFATGTLGAGGRMYSLYGKVEATLGGHNGQGALDLEYNRAGTMILTEGKDATAELWDVKTHKRIGTFRGPTDWVVHGGFSPNGEMVAVGSTDRSVEVYGTKSAKLITALPEQCAVGSPICFTSDGKYLLTVGVDDFVRTWTITPAQAGAVQPERRTGHTSRRRRRHGGG